MSTQSVARQRKTVDFPFHSVRNISSPEDLENDRKIYVGQTRISHILEFSTDENVRKYYLDAEGKKRRTTTQVHRAIKDTLENYSHKFSVLNSGVTIVARHCDVDDTNKCLRLLKPGIINGAQTQGVIKDFLKKYGLDLFNGAGEPHVKFEIIVTDDEELIAEISIARNFQNDVLTVSIAGRMGQLDELEKRFQEGMPGYKLQKSETMLSDDYIRTERLLQVITALIPESIWPKGRDFNKVFTYSQKTKCLKDFQAIYSGVYKNAGKPNERDKALYDFCLDVCVQAWELYEKWKSHQGFAGTRLRAVERAGKKIIEVPDGIVFPILASLSVFASKRDGRWHIDVPTIISDDELIQAAKNAYIDIAKSNPNMVESPLSDSDGHRFTDQL